MTEPERTAPPEGILLEDDLAPRSPFSWLREAALGGFSREGWQLLAAWAAFTLATSAAWAAHLQQKAGWSALPAHWGEHLSARQAWELWENGGLSRDLLGPYIPWLTVGTLLWALWASWRLQARTVDLPSRLGPWCYGFLDALLLGTLPLGLVGWMATGALEWMAASGIHGLGWLDLVGGTLLRLACVSAWMLQWWFCRLGRAQGAWQGLPGYVGHLRDSFLRLWIHPVQWTLLVLGGVVLRTGLGFAVLLLAWRLGGGTSVRVWLFLGLQVLVSLVSAWSLGWFLRLSALFWQQDARVRQAIADLRRRSDSPEVPVEG